MTVHPRPASPGTTTVVETDHPPVELSSTTGLAAGRQCHPTCPTPRRPSSFPRGTGQQPVTSTGHQPPPPPPPMPPPETPPPDANPEPPAEARAAVASARSAAGPGDDTACPNPEL